MVGRGEQVRGWCLIHEVPFIAFLSIVTPEAPPGGKQTAAAARNQSQQSKRTEDEGVDILATRVRNNRW